MLSHHKTRCPPRAQARRTQYCRYCRPRFLPISAIFCDNFSNCVRQHNIHRHFYSIMKAFILCVVLFLELGNVFAVHAFDSNQLAAPQDRRSSLLIMHQLVLRRAAVGHLVGRKLEDQSYPNNDDGHSNHNNGGDDNDDMVVKAEQYSEEKFVDMFWTPPASWNALQWVFFCLLLSINSLLFFCFCIACIIPRCCHKSAPMMYAAMV